MNVLITGANGFIGKHVVSRLNRSGFYTIGLGRRPVSDSEANEYICCDLGSDEVKDIPLKVSGMRHIDGVIHLAADMRREPHNVHVVIDNCGGTQRLLEMCEAEGIPVFLQLSSLPVIGRPLFKPITEDHPLAPPTVYHATKIMEELLAGYADHYRGLRTASFRISAPVGIGMNEKTIFPTFIRKALKNEDLVLQGKGSRKQTYIHVNDIADALILALNKPDARGVYNLSSYNLLSNYELADRVIRVLSSQSQITFSGSEDPYDNDIWEVSLKRIHDDLGYEPQITIDTAITELAQHYTSSTI